DNRNPASDQRQDHVLADQLLVALILRMNCNSGIAEHRLRARRRNDDEGRTVLRIERLSLDRVAQVPKVSLGLDLDNLEIGDGREQLGIPIDQPLVLVDESGAMKFYKNFKNGARQTLVHREALARPVA